MLRARGPPPARPLPGPSASCTRVIPYGDHSPAAIAAQGDPAFRQPPSPPHDARSDGDPDPQLRGLPAARNPLAGAPRPGPGGRPPRDLSHRELRQVAAPGVYPLRAGQAPLRARRVPPVAPHLRPADEGHPAPHQGAAGRGGGVPRRPAHHAGRGGVHHQRGGARGGQPVAPQPRRRFRGRGGRRRAAPAQLPHHPRARQLDRTQRDPKGKSASTRAASSRR